MKKFARLLLVCATLVTMYSFSQSPPTIGTVTSAIVQKNTGDNYIVVNGISDNDVAIQNLTITAVSSNDAILSVTGVMYTQGQTFAIVKVREFGVDGTVTIDFTATDSDSPTSKPFSIEVGTFFQKGCLWSIYDIVFWQANFPSDNEVSKLDSILPRVELPTDTRIWDNLGMTANIQLGGPPTWQAHDAYTTGYRGTIVPSLTGIYMFTLRYQDTGEFRIASTSQYFDATNIGGFKKGTSPVYTDTVYLKAGVPYGYKAVYWTVFSEIFDLRYAYLGANPMNVTTVTLFNINNDTGISTPGTNLVIPGFVPNQTVAGAVTFQVLGTTGLLTTYANYDIKKPTSVSGLTLVRKGNDRIEIKWNPSSDEKGLKNYNVYLDGVLHFKTKNDKQHSYNITQLAQNTTYSIFVTASDKANNESSISDVILETTFGNDITAPTSPTNLVVDVLADMSAKVSWSPSIDNESSIFGYIVSVDGILYTVDTLNATSVILKTFNPMSSHTFSVIALNGSFIASFPSTTLGFTTLAYDPLLTSPGVKKLRMNISKEFIGKIDGFGLNAGFDDYSTQRVNDIKRVNPGLIRWGTLDANNISYSNATNGSRTYAKFINLANNVDAAVSISIGVDATPLSDWRDESIVNVNFGTTATSMSVMERTAQQMIAYLFAPDSMATKSNPGTSFFPYHAEVQKRLNEGFRQTTFTGVASKFKSLIIEFGNEVWGGTSFGVGVDHNANGFDNFTTYGVWARKMARAFKSSPYYDSTKVKIAYSLRDPVPVPTFLDALLAPTPDADMGDLLSPAGYLGGNLTYTPEIPLGESELSYYKNGFEYMFNNLNGLYTHKLKDNQLRKKQRSFFLYEAAMTKPSYNQRMGQALILTDYFLTAHKVGSYYPGLFSYEGGEWGITSSNFTTFNPMFKSALLLNNLTKGNKDILNSSVSTFEKVLNDDGNPINNSGNYLEPVSTHFYHKDGKYTLVLLSRDFDESFQVQLNFPSGMLLTPTVSGASMFVFSTPGNYSSREANVSSSIASISNNMIVTVPKYAMVVYTFTGEVLPDNRQKLGFSNFRLPTAFGVSIENSTGDPLPIISEQFANISFVASVTGGVDATRAVGWSITKPDSVTTLDVVYVDQNTIRINPTNCRSNGVITVTGFLVLDPNSFQTYIVTISGQLNDGLTEQIQCPTFNGSPRPVPDDSTQTPPTSLYKKQNASLLKIYPNPSNGFINIETDKLGTVTILNMQGNQVLTKNITTQNSSIQLELNAGIYFAVFNSNTGESTRLKIIITK